MSDRIMDYKPLNDDHAIERVKFAYLLSRDFEHEDFIRAKARHREIRSELPAAVTFGQGQNTSVEFSFMRPDASAIWKLELEDNLISVECTRYTRWDRVWSAAERLLGFGLSVAAEGGGCSLIGAAMMVTDKFLALKGEPDLSTLFQGNELLPSSVFARRLIWHTHSGWLDVAESSMVVNTLRVDSEFEEQGDEVEAEGDPATVVVLQHVQRFQPKDPIAHSPDGASSLAAAVDRMHGANKHLVKSLLTPEMSGRIGLSTLGAIS